MGSQLSENIGQLKMTAKDGKNQSTNLKNLTITTSDNDLHGPYGGASGKLFGCIHTSFYMV